MKNKSNSLQKKVKQLEKSVQRLHNIAWVIGIVAGFFGIGSTFGYLAFNNISNKLASLESNIDFIDKTIEENIKQREKQAVASLQIAAKQLFNRFSSWGSSKPQDQAEKDVVFDGRSGRSTVSYCPEGHYVIGMQVIDNDNSETCISCINGVRFICRGINY